MHIQASIFKLFYRSCTMLSHLLIITLIGQNELRMAQTKDFMAVFQQLDPAIPLVCICGNHDLGDQPTPESLERYIIRKNVFPYPITLWYLTGTKMCLEMIISHFGLEEFFSLF